MSVSTKPAAPSAVANVLKLPASTAVSTMSLAWADTTKTEANKVAMRDFLIIRKVQNIEAVEYAAVT